MTNQNLTDGIASTAGPSANVFKEDRAIRGIVFDWYSTLAAPYDDDFWTRIPQIIEQAGGRAYPEAIADWEANPIEHTAHSVSETSYRFWQANRLAALFIRCGIAEPARTALAEDLSGIRYQRLFEIFPDVPQVLAELRHRGLRLGLCSNWDWDLDRHLHHNRIHNLFDVIVCSASAGFRKPHPRIFANVIDLMGLRPENMLFVGDSWPDDVEGAVAAGFQPVHLARTVCAVTEHGKARCIKNLESLAALL